MLYSSVDIHNHLQELDIPHEVFKVQRPAKNLGQAASGLGLAPDELGRVDLFVADGKPLMVVVPGDKKVDGSKLKEICGAKRLRPATREEVVSFTGCVWGFIPPIGLKTRMPTYIDYYTLREDVIYTGCGDTTSILKIRSYDLVRATGAEIVDVVAEQKKRRK